MRLPRSTSIRSAICIGLIGELDSLANGAPRDAATRPSPCFSKRNCDGIAFREGSKSSAISGMGVFGHYFPTVVQHACNMLVHGLHARKQPLPVVLPRPISFVCERLHSHLVTASALFLAPFPFTENLLDR